jgi:purine-binding chemotaxis protein CheW
MATQTEPQADAQALAGQYLTFVLAEESYGLEILKVREIIQMCKITPVPRTPDYIEGVINLRGKVIPIVDLRSRFDLPRQGRTEQTCIIVVHLDGVETGLIVDQVSEVIDIAAGEIDEAPAMGTDADTEYILGMGKQQEKVTILLDIARALNGGELAELAVESSGRSED